jgi:predicted aldo/keto reductase-like oxidoreductase
MNQTGVKMERITLGQTGLKVHRLGFGGIPIQRVDETQAIETVLHAVNSGVDFIDTSRAYKTSEERIGRALQQTDRKVVLASKSHNRSADGMRRDIDTSLKYLKTDFIDLYQCHFVKDKEDFAKIVSPGGCLGAMLKAKEEGLIGHIGLTSHSLDLLADVLEQDLFETIMVCFSFLEPAAAEKVIPRALEKNVGVIAMKSFSGGVLTDPQLALKFVLSKPGVVSIPGVEDKHLFDQNWSVYQGDWQLSEDETKEIDKIRKQYDKVFCRRCDYCQPCSEDIPIQAILGMRSVIGRFGEAVLQKEWIKTGLEKARRCSQCGECMERCPYDLPIPDLIEGNLRWLDEEFNA